MLISAWLIGALVVLDVDVETVVAVVVVVVAVASVVVVPVVVAVVGVVEVGVAVVVLVVSVVPVVLVVMSVVAPVVTSAASSKLVLLNKNAALIAIAILFFLNMGLLLCRILKTTRFTYYLYFRSGVIRLG